MRILIVDPEYLVAMEAERILGEAFEGCEPQIAMPRDYASVLESRDFNVVLIDSELLDSSETERRLRTSKAAIVFSTFVGEERPRLAGWPGVAVVRKPFDEHELAVAIKNAALE